MIFSSIPSQAQGMSIIRDTEIENILQKWAEPVIDASGLSSDQVDLILINRDEVNAFVAGGANIFIYTGLILKAEYPEEIIGVMAHEVGHITGGHLVSTKNAMERASFQSILSTVLGIGAAIATGDGRAANAIGVGGTGFAASGFLRHSRIQESAADQAGLKYLDGASINPAGMVTFLEKLEDQELLPVSQQSEYMRTHPLTRDRINSMRIGAEKSPLYNELGQSERQRDFDMVKAKLLAFTQPQNIPRYYDRLSKNMDDRYAYAIMHYQQNHFDKSIKIFDDLILENPKNPYFVEMRAQTQRDYGRLEKAENDYKKALKLLNGDAPLIQVSLAHVMIEQQKHTQYIEDLLISSLQKDKRNTTAYRLLATLKGRQGFEAQAQYYLAEEAILQGHKKDAKRLVSLAKKSGDLPQGLSVKANDLEIYLNRLLAKDN